ncbi:MAG: protein phosphatase 2C domain-containing protein [Thermodesulfobacteriota bacterium]
MRITATAVSDIGRVRKTNQDSVGCFPDVSLFLLADGMGGLKDGEVASRLAIDVIAHHVQTGNGDAQRDDAGVLRSAIASANERILHEGEARGELSGRVRIGATIVALRVLPEQGRALWAHVGDSRLYRVRDGKLTLLTADHTVAGAAYRDQGNVPLDLPHTNMLVQALGVAQEVEPSLGSDDVRPGDLFLLCSDGVSGLLKPDQLERTLAEDLPLEAKAQNLIRLALEASGRDNASVVLVQVVPD